ncbi:UNVERIFIED_CONTAM: protein DETOXIFICATION 27 [Sesamum radiatum]|uniref:Protein DETOXIFICATION n=1 Tax=Sesamum radiatum TaxID=300843 RepID=A0AAW2VR92_SESRA
MSNRGEPKENLKAPLLEYSYEVQAKHVRDYNNEEIPLHQKVWTETKKLWRIVGPAIFSRIASYSMFVVTQAFAGHLGDLELAGVSIASRDGKCAGDTLRAGVRGEEVPHAGSVSAAFMDSSVSLLCSDAAALLLRDADSEAAGAAGGRGGAVGEGGHVVHSCPFQLRVSVSSAEVSAEPAEEQRDGLGELGGARDASAHQLAHCLPAAAGRGGTALTLDFSWWVIVLGLFLYTVCGGCPLTWTGFSVEAFSGLWEFLKLSASSGVMLCLENWYYRILIVMTGNLENAKIAVDALSVCMSINGWELMIPLAFFAGTGVRVANELGAGNGKGAKFATIVSVSESVAIGLVFWVLIMLFHNEFALIYTTSEEVLGAVSKLSILLAFTVLLNSVQPILSGVAVGSGWQSYVAYINLGCYYLIGVPLGVLMGWVFHQGVMGIWAGMIFGGTAVQTVILAIITMRCDWEKEAAKATMHVKKWSESRNNV